MANPNNPFGFEVFKVEGKECRIREYIKDTAAAIYPGDVVTMANDGEVTPAAAGDVVLGVCAKYEAAANTTVAVYDDPEAEFFVQSAAAPFALADIGLNANIVATSADTTRKQSNHNLSGTMATTASLQFKIIGMLDRGENAVGSYTIVRVKPNNHKFKAGNAGL